MMVSLQAFLKYSHNVYSHIISSEKSFPIIPYTAGTHSPRQYRTKINHSITHRSKNSGTPIGIQKDRVKCSSLHFSRQGGIDGSRVK